MGTHHPPNSFHLHSYQIVLPFDWKPPLSHSDKGIEAREKASIVDLVDVPHQKAQAPDVDPPQDCQRFSDVLPSDRRAELKQPRSLAFGPGVEEMTVLTQRFVACKSEALH